MRRPFARVLPAAEPSAAGQPQGATDPGLGVVVDLSKRQLDVRVDGELQASYEVAVGQPGHRTPPGSYGLKQVTWNPDWVPPDSEWAEDAERRDAGFFVGDMIPTVIDDDIDAARAVNRKTMSGYVTIPNYRNYTAGNFASQMGMWVRQAGSGVMELSGHALSNPVAPYDLVKTMRASILATTFG